MASKPPDKKKGSDYRPIAQAITLEEYKRQREKELEPKQLFLPQRGSIL